MRQVWKSFRKVLPKRSIRAPRIKEKPRESTYIDELDLVDHTALPDLLDQAEAVLIVTDGQTEQRIGLLDLDLLRLAFHVNVDGVLQVDLPIEQIVHVDFVGVQGAEENLSERALEMCIRIACKTHTKLQ